MRIRERHLEYAAAHMQRMQKALIHMNRKGRLNLTAAQVSDWLGVDTAKVCGVLNLLANGRIPTTGVVASAAGSCPTTTAALVSLKVDHGKLQWTTSARVRQGARDGFGVAVTPVVAQVLCRNARTVRLAREGLTTAGLASGCDSESDR